MTQSSHRTMIELGRPQFGVVTRKQLLKTGFTGSLIDHHLRNGLLWPVFRGVYVIGRPAELRKTIWMAATLAAGPGSMLAGLSAAEYWGIVKYRKMLTVHRPSGENRTMVGRSPAQAPLRLYLRQRPSIAELTASPEGIPVKTVPGALIDIAEVLSDRALGAAISEASRLGYLRAGGVERILEYGRGRKGVNKLRNHLRFWSPESMNVLSVLETLFRKLCQVHSIEMPLSNRMVCGLKVDFLWPKERVVVETDGFSFHGDIVSFKRDHNRLSTLTRNGYLVLSFTYWQVTETPEEVAEAVLVGLRTWGK
ncbi:MAG: DUF559 domain-containing protein [Solirubrobacterales bacterium]|nr:DUF559 domain-containing protein [Solirubrobacterales bacterium]